MQLHQAPLRRVLRVDSIDWPAIPQSEGHRLRSLGLEEGALVEPLHRGILFFRDPLAVRVGRMTIALRRKVALAIHCTAID
ncbi:ferrous iron transport protein A [Sphingorhabdus arenilitoris]|uniref:Ferrous iron transport protein A n=1 Tax=Sphingorhabdus arenilitoris TaxID=1490041 RepID=A0ABV8RFT7_9SPHN